MYIYRSASRLSFPKSGDGADAMYNIKGSFSARSVLPASIYTPDICERKLFRATPICVPGGAVSIQS